MDALNAARSIAAIISALIAVVRLVWAIWRKRRVMKRLRK